MKFISTNGRPSNSAKDLVSTGHFKRWRGVKLLRTKDVVINWGSTQEYPTNPRIINAPYNVGVAANKLTTFSVLANSGVSIVPWTANLDIVKEWLAEKSMVVVRSKLTGHSGEGITILRDEELPEELPIAPLYTRYIKKEREFRVHATKTGVFLTQKKIRDPDKEPTCWQIRSHDNGFMFVVGNIDPDEARDKLAVEAINVLGLDFGAVDIIEKKGIFYVLEVNTAPGLEGNTLEVYTNMLKELAA